MSFYQRISAVITGVFLIITFAIAFTCFTSPFSGIFVTQLTALTAAELILGGICLFLYRERDSEIVYSVGAFWFVGILYFLFVLVMLLVAYGSILLKYFILTHFIGFALALILLLVFVLGHHGIVEQRTSTVIIKADKKQLIQKFNLLIMSLRNSFPNEKKFIRDCEKVAEDLRFSADSSPATEIIEYDIDSLLDIWEKQERKSIENHVKTLSQLKEMVEKRSVVARLQ